MNLYKTTEDDAESRTPEESILRSFRVKKRVLETLEHDAKKRNLTLNAFVNSLLERYVEKELLTMAFGTITFALPTFHEMRKTMSEDALKQVARKAGSLNIKETANQRGYPFRMDIYLKLLKNLTCDYGKWAQCEESIVRGKKKVVLTHNEGLSWSFFIKEYIEAGIFEFAKKGQVESIEAHESCVVITISDMH